MERIKRAATGRVAQVGLATVLATGGAQALDAYRASREAERQERIVFMLASHEAELRGLREERRAGHDSAAASRAALHNRLSAIESALIEAALGHHGKARRILDETPVPADEAPPPAPATPPPADVRGVIRELLDAAPAPPRGQPAPGP